MEDNCFTMLCRFLPYNIMNQSYMCVIIYIYIYMSLLLTSPPAATPSCSSESSQSARLGSLLFSSFPLAIYFTPGSVYMSRLLSQIILMLSFPCCAYKSVLHICVSSSDPINVTSLITCIPPILQDYCFLHYQIWD